MSVFPGRSSELFVFVSPSIFYEFSTSERTFIRGFVFARNTPWCLLVSVNLLPFVIVCVVNPFSEFAGFFDIHAIGLKPFSTC